MATGRLYQADLTIDITLSPAVTGLLYQAALALPETPPALRGRVYQASLTTPAAGGGLTARVYQAVMTVPAAEGQSPPSGIWAAKSGNLSPCGLRAAVNGHN
jgi:hypothetical protein